MLLDVITSPVGILMDMIEYDPRILLALGAVAAVTVLLVVRAILKRRKEK